MPAELLPSLQPGAVALGWTLLDFLWQGVLIGVGYALLRAALPQPRQRLLAGHAALLALAMTPLATLVGHLQDEAPPAALQAAGGAMVSAMEATTRGTGIAAETWLLWIVAAWVSGVAMLSVRLWNEWRRLRRLCDTAEPVDADWQRRFDALAARLGVSMNVRLRQGAHIVTPMLVGVLRPTILLPASLFARLPVDQLELVLVHELAHLRRLDPLFNLLQTGLDTLLFYHPAVHWISRKVREDRELCCDEVVVASGGDRLRYARALLALAEARAHEQALPLPALAASGGALLERVERIVELPAPRASNSQSVVAVMLLAVLALAWFVPREQKLAMLDVLPVALVPGAMPIESPARELAIADLAARLTPVFDAPLRIQAPDDPVVAPPAVELVGRPAAIAVPVAQEAVAPPQASDYVPPSLPVELRSAAAESRPAPSAPAVEALRRVAPDYPRAARMRGVEGFVVLDYRVDANGRVVDVAIRDAQPAGAFDAAARRALERWRFPEASGLDAVQTQRFDFVLSDDERSGQTDRCRRQTGTRVCRPMQELLPGSSVSLSVN